MKKQNYEKIAALRHRLHEHPELSMQEHWTKQHLMDFLAENTSLELVDRGRWFYAVYRGEKAARNIAFRADMDALPIEEDPELFPYASRIPGVGHKCGHDGHSAALAGLGLELENSGTEQNVFLLFQHAEETGQGAAECLPFLEENQIREIFAVHNLPGIPLGSIAAPTGVVQFASVGMTLRFHGKKSHACYPENGRNPAYAISKIILALESLRESQNYRGMTLITVIQVRVGEHAFGTSAGEGELLLTVRGAHEDELQDLLEKISAFAGEQAETYGLELEIHYEDEFADCFNHEESVCKILKAAQKLQIPVEKLEEPFRASEDFGRFTKKVPGAIFYVGDGVDYPPIHTLPFDFPDQNLETIVEMYKEILRESGENV